MELKKDSISFTSIYGTTLSIQPIFQV